MAGSLNRVELIGNLGKDPEIRTTNDGTKICSLSIATSETWKDKNTGDRKEIVEWHRVVIFNEALVSVAERFLRKGDKVFLSGALKTRKWADTSGTERYATEVVLQRYRGEITMLSSKRDNDEGYSGGGQSSGGGGARGTARPNVQDLDDDIPF